MSTTDTDFASLFAASPNPYLVLDRSLNIVTANRAYLASTKRELSDIVGRWAWDAFPTDPETERLSVASFERVLRTGEPDTMPLWRFDIPRPAAEGGGFEKRYWSITHTPVKNAAGEVTMVMQHPIDVTELERLRDIERSGQIELDPSHSGIFERAHSVQQANVALHAQTQRLQELFAQAPVFMAVLRGPDHCFEFTNQAYDSLIGHRRVIGMPLRAALQEAQGQGLMEHLDQVYASGLPFTADGMEIHLRTGPEGPLVRRVVDFACQPIKEPGGQVYGIFVVGIDVTTAASTLEALRESEGRFRILADTVPDIVWMTNAKGRIDFLNRRWRDYTGNASHSATPAEQAAAAIHPDDQGATQQAFGDARRTGQPFQTEHRIRSAEGLYRWFMVQGKPYYDPASGEIVRWIGSSVDIHERKMAAQELQASDARHAFLVRLGDELRTIADPLAIQGKAVRLLGDHLGVARVLYADYQDAQGRGQVHDDHARDDLPSLAGTYDMGDFPDLHQWMRAGGPVVIPDMQTCTALSQAERARLASLHLASLISIPLVKEGQLFASLLVADAQARDWDASAVETAREVADRTWAAVERAKAEAALRDADRRKDEFLATLAHELRNPLAPIRNGIQIARLSIAGDAQVQRTLAMMDRQLSHLVRLVDDLLDVGRIASGKLVLQRTPVRMREVLANSVESVRSMFDARGHELILHIPQHDLCVLGDFDRLAQVFINLLSNAAKYTEPHGRITLWLEQEGAEVVVRVTDTGVGIPAGELTRVFELFSQVRAHQGRSEGGLGIGLSLVRSIVSLHEGSVSAHSGGPAVGSVFTVRLPVLNAPAHGGTFAAAGATSVATRARRVLVVDDNVDAATTLAALLEMQGHEVHTAHGGAAALALAQHTAFDVVLLDLGMPGMDGIETAQHLRRTESGRSSLLVAMTGWGQESDRQRTHASGFDHHLVKPVDVAVVLELVSGANQK